MEPELPRPGLHGSVLLGLLAQLALIDSPTPTPAPVQGLGRWLGWEDAIALSAALQTPEPPGLGSPVRAAKLAQQLQRDLQRLRTELAGAMQQDGSQPGDTDFAPYRRHYAARQQAMGDAVGALRARARAALALTTPQMQRLAELDAVLDPALARREQALLALLPTLLERHFNRLRPARDAAPGADWLNTFRHDMRRMALAELDLRLLPLQGLLDTLAPQAHTDP